MILHDEGGRTVDKWHSFSVMLEAKHSEGIVFVKAYKTDRNITRTKKCRKRETEFKKIMLNR